MTRSRFNESTSPLQITLAHDLVPFLEILLSLNSQTLNLDVPLVSTRIPHTSLPKSIINSDCKIIYTHTNINAGIQMMYLCLHGPLFAIWVLRPGVPLLEKIDLSFQGWIWALFWWNISLWTILGSCIGVLESKFGTKENCSIHWLPFLFGGWK